MGDPTATTPRKGGLAISTNHPDEGQPLTLDMLRHTYVTTHGNVGEVPTVVVRLGGPYQGLGYEWNYAAFKLRVESGWLADAPDLTAEPERRWRTDIESLPKRLDHDASEHGA